jgi:hypothetical protein
MKANFGAIVVAGVGKLGGQVFCRSNAGTILKRKSSPPKRSSIYQDIEKSYISLIAGAWRSLLESERILWINASSLFPQKNDFGATVFLSGFGLYSKINLNRLVSSQSLLSLPPSTISSFGFTSFTAFASIVSNTLILTFSPSIPAGFIVKIFASRAVSRGVAVTHRQSVLLGSLSSSDISPVSMGSTYANRYGALAKAGLKIFLSIIPCEIVSGIESQPIPVSIKTPKLIYNDLGTQFSLTNHCYSASWCDENTVLITDYPGHILRSTDKGLTYSDSGQLYSTTILYLSQYANGVILAGAGTGKILRSTDKGLNWANLGQQSSLTGQVNTFCYLGSEIWIAGCGGRILRSTDNGLNWTNLGQQFSETGNGGAIYLGNGVVLTGTSPDAYILRSTDFGLTWSKSASLDHQINNIIQCDNGVIIVSTGDVGRMWRSTDLGVSWVQVPDANFHPTRTGLATSLGLGLNYAENGIVLCTTYKSGGPNYILISDDYGINWYNYSGLIQATTASYPGGTQLLNNILIIPMRGSGKIVRGSLGISSS